MQTEHRRVVLETERHRIVGAVTVPAEGHHNRLSDLLNREGVQFLSLVDATVSDHDGEDSETLPFVAVALEHIQLAFEAE